ncbi:MAG: hypothetical protein AABZ45_04995 [Pseudomonadota bacterium]
MDHHETALAFVVGALSPAERAEVARRRLYDGALDKAILAEELRLVGLDQVPSSARPSEELWSRISGAMALEQAAFAHARPEVFSDGQWERHNEKIDRKDLWSDKAMLLRCGPGAVEGDHDQDSSEDEHILVIAGDVVMGGRTFSTGDYIFVEAGSNHGEMTTRDGCILFSQYVAH